LASSFDKPLFFAHERGIPAGLTVASVEGIDSFEGTMTVLREVHANGPGEYRTLVFDTLDALEPYVVEYTCAKNNWKNIEAPSFGKGWVACSDEWRRFFRAITAIRNKHGLTIVLVCHAGIERVDDPRVPSYTCYAPKLHKRAREQLMDASDVVAFFSDDLRTLVDKGGFQERTRATSASGRFLFLEGRPAFFAKNRFGMPPKMEITKDFDIKALTQYWTVRNAMPEEVAVAS
jgi:AAA domain